MNPGVYQFKERSADEHELHKVFDGANWHFGAAGIGGALQSAELGAKGGEYDLNGPRTRPLRVDVLDGKQAKRFDALVERGKVYSLVTQVDAIAASTRRLLLALDGMDRGCIEPGFQGHENGFGEPAGDELQAAREELAALIGYVSVVDAEAPEVPFIETPMPPTCI